MNRIEFVIAASLGLLLAFAVGWFAYWLVYRFTRVTRAEMGELEAMASALHEAEEVRDQAIAYLQEREAELASQLLQSEAELRAAMEGLRDARRENEELRTALERSRERG
ncbi:MAG: hypothetical protein IT545_16740 [Rhodobacteraceae bacterium]|nr:hypothetical protein [Paracoccaceae bacterium]